MRQHHLVVRIQCHRLPLGVVRLTELAVEVARTQIAPRHQHLSAIREGSLLELHQHGHVGVAAHVLVEVGRSLVEVELLENHMTHGHGQRRISALLGVHPFVTELGNLGVVRRDRHRLCAAVTCLGEEVRIGRARLGHVGAPRNDEVRVEPFRGLANVCLLPPDLWTRRRQIAIPVVEAARHPSDEIEVAGSRGITHHRHRRDGGEAVDAIRSVLLDGVDVGCGHHLVHIVPGGADEAAHAAQPLVLCTLCRVLDDVRPGLHRAPRLARLAPESHQLAAHHGVFHTVGRVQIPAGRGSALTAPRLVIGHVPTGAGVIGLLSFPGDDAAFDVNLP